MTDTTASETSTAELTPQMKPLALPKFPLAYRGGLWRPVMVDALGQCIIGGPTGLSVLELFSRQRVWYSITPQVWFTGFAIHETTLYVQDGPVLYQWDLTDGVMRAAINLSTQKQWQSTQGALTDTTRAALHALSTDLTAKQQALQQARNAAAWADLLEEADTAEAALFAQVQKASAAQLDAAYEQLTQVRGMARALRTMAGSSTPTQADPAAIQKLRDALVAAEKDAAAIIFSAPRVRAEQLQAQTGGSIFSLAGDGTLHAMNNALSYIGTARLTAPLHPTLALYEDTSVTSGQVPCVLGYLTAAGSLQVVNASTTPPQALQSWSGDGSIDAGASLLPLTASSGYFWGGGVPGHGFFGIPVNSVTSGPTLGVDGTWTDYEIASKESLALVSDGLNTHLVAFADGTHVVERWGTLTANAAGWTSFWTDDGLDASSTDDTPRLVLQTEKDGTTSSPAGLTLRVYVANTIDDPNGNIVYDAPAPLASSILRPGSFTGSTFAQLRAPLAILRDTAYAAIGSATPLQQLLTLTTVSNGSSPWSQFQDTYRTQYGTGANGAWNLAACPLPSLTSSDQVAVFSLASLKETVTPLAVTQLDTLANTVLSSTYSIRVTLLDKSTHKLITRTELRVTIAGPTDTSWSVKTDDNGMFTVNPFDSIPAPDGVDLGTIKLMISIASLSDHPKVSASNVLVSLSATNTVYASYSA